jgi:hypothetical protein
MENLQGMMVERLGVYFEKNRRQAPKHILFYRDGVSESQYGMVYGDELNQVKKAFKKFSDSKKLENYSPAVTMLVVGKRHHTRFFPKNENATDNLSAGLVIDHTVVTPQFDNFYLQSHDCPIGTARSGHYVVITNESGYSADELQRVVSTFVDLTLQI